MDMTFAYDVEKDMRNWRTSFNSSNNPTPSRMHQQYIDRYGLPFEQDKLRSLIDGIIEEKGIVVAEEIKRMEDDWHRIEKEFIRRIEEMFGIKSTSSRMTAYLTTDVRCSYNLKENYFFVSIFSKYTNRIIMHELMHFWTWYVFRDYVDSNKIDAARYNDIKESLTVLLNIEFKDLMGDAIDKGYPQHQQMRAAIEKEWLKSKDIRKVFRYLVEKAS